VQVGDLVLFRGSWVPRADGTDPKTGVVLSLWYNGRTKRLQTTEVLWDNGEVRKVMSNLLGVICESR
jgi:hypothetical protein